MVELKKGFSKVWKSFLPLHTNGDVAFIFLYHTIEKDGEIFPWTHGHRYVTPLKNFKIQIEFIKKHFNIVSTSDLIHSIQFNKHKGKMLAAIHFDDGFRSYIDIAVPHLNALKIPSTVFLTYNNIRGDIPLRNKIAYCINTKIKMHYLAEMNKLQEEMNMYAIDLRKMSIHNILAWSKKNFTTEMEQLTNEIFAETNGCSTEKSPFLNMKLVTSLNNMSNIEIGSHTLSHPMLSKLNLEQQKYEILTGHQKLEELLGKSLCFFAYPFGGRSHFNKDSRDIVASKEGLTAFSTYGGINCEFDNTDMKRITVTDQSAFSLKRIIISNFIH